MAGIDEMNNSTISLKEALVDKMRIDYYYTPSFLCSKSNPVSLILKINFCYIYMYKLN